MGYISGQVGCLKAYVVDDPPRLKICNISGGLGLTVEIKLVGNNSGFGLRDISLSINVTRGVMVNVPKGIYDIPGLLVGESTEVVIDISGIGLGIKNKCPVFSIKVSAPKTKPVEKIIITRVLGPFVGVIENNDPRSFEGYNLYTPEYSTKTYLINNGGEIVHTWRSNYIQDYQHICWKTEILSEVLPRDLIQPLCLAGLAGVLR